MATALIRSAAPADLDALKALADQHKRELGFVRRGALLESIRKEHLILAEVAGQLAGFVQFHHRRDGQTTIHLILVATTLRQHGIGHQLLEQLGVECRRRGQQRIGLKCPADLPANDFYRRAGFACVAHEPGKLRSLNIWHRSLIVHHHDSDGLPQDDG